jgi:cytochrome c biogenesis protein CcmG, thiol:disulfide interchange protein DsbE
MSKRSRNRATARQGRRQPSQPRSTPGTAPVTGSPSDQAAPAGSSGRPATASAQPGGVRARDRRRQPQRRSRTLPLVIGGIAIVAAAAIALLLSQGADTSARPSTAVGSAGAWAGASGGTVTGGALPAFESGAEDAAVGQPIPEVSGASFDGSPVSIERDGTPKLLLFLAHWCPHCREEVPRVQDWIDANGLPDGVDFLSVATSIDPNRPNHPPEAWLAGEGWTPPVLVDGDDRIATAFGLTAFPYWVAVKGDGTVAQRWTGSVDLNQLQGLFDGLRATTPSGEPSGSAVPSGS